MSKKVFCGTVIKVYNKTIKVSVLRTFKDKLYKKVIRRYSKYTAHADSDIYKNGDKVLIQEHRPISSTKTWIVINNEDLV
ncbi:30S ribosomal protein S17 [Wolbachia endosymbiont of Pentidionis agamae]|uniref:30S ribosomal protein S17 n=1 Tax=Wolbachia endosymbiont of Pentidionis agamae TaxID=3110435 RepID=UPI002FD4570F